MAVYNDDSCGVHSRPYHSCVIACVMQVREEHAMGHDSGVMGVYIESMYIYAVYKMFHKTNYLEYLNPYTHTRYVC